MSLDHYNCIQRGITIFNKTTGVLKYSLLVPRGSHRGLNSLNAMLKTTGSICHI